MPDFSPERWQQVEAILDVVFDLPPDERSAWLDAHCADDPTLRADVEALLAADKEEEAFLEVPVGAFAPALVQAADVTQQDRTDALLQNQEVGPYRLVRALGEGGMGTVYLAERADGLFEQQVAVKLIKRGMDSEAVRRRFVAERQILARLQHPHIARLLDGGLTDDGRSYFVMEYVDGVPITKFSATQELGLSARLRLFEKVCRAVEYAHRNLVVHRDLKPSNILVTADGTVKLLDFGIAKVLADDETPLFTQTETGLMAMTPEYAAPEQVKGEAITTATDVYALGIVLYELLTGTRPYQFDQRSPTEIERVVCGTAPPRPSTAVQRGSDTLPPFADDLHRKLRGDLDTLVLKALRKEPERRYASAFHLLDDLQRYRDGLPILARPDTTAYRLRKFVGRHRLSVVMTTALVLLSLGFAIVHTQRITAERDRAQLEAQKAEEVKNFVLGLFEVSNPNEARGDTITARALLERGSQRLATELRNQPTVQAEMMQVVGEVYHKLGLTARADTMVQGALAVLQEHHGPKHPALVPVWVALAQVQYQAGTYDEAAEAATTAVELSQSLHGENAPETAAALQTLANIERARGNLDAAEALARQTLALHNQHAHLSEASREDALANLGAILFEQGQYDEAEPVYRERLALAQSLYEPPHTMLAIALNDLGLLLKEQGHLDDAEPYYRDALVMHTTLLGDNHQEVAISSGNLASLLHTKGDLDAAEPLYQKALAIFRTHYGDDHPYVATSISNLGTLYFDRRDFADAERMFREVLALDQRFLGDDHPYIAGDLTKIAATLHQQEALTEAAAMYTDAIARYRATFPDGHPRLIRPLLGHADVLMDQGHLSEAETALRDLHTWGLENLDAGHWQRATIDAALGHCLSRQTRYAEAEPLLLQAHEHLLRDRGPSTPETQDAARHLHQLYMAWGKPAEAARFAE